MRTDEILQRLQVKKKTGEVYWCKCPAHEDSGAHLSIKEVKDHEGNRVLAKCFRGCDFKSIVKALNLRECDFFEKEEQWVESCGEITDQAIQDRCEGYIKLLEALPLNGNHKQHLLDRGFTDSEVEQFAFRSFDSKSASGVVYDKTVPGFDKGKGWKRVQGILIPCLDDKGRIWALKVKNDAGPKYTWYSSSGNLGKVFSYHGENEPKPIRIVEGVLKSNLAHALLCRKGENGTTIGIGGVNVWKGVADHYQGKKQDFVICFDQDGKQETTIQIERFRERLLLDGHNVSVELWDPKDGKGIDDVLLAGKPTRVIKWGQADSRPRGLPGSPTGDYGGLNARRASEIQSERIDWIIPNWIPRGYVVHLSGSPGVGKGLLTALLTKSLTTGSGLSKAGIQRPPVTVAIFNREDGAGSVIKPRLVAAGADLDRCFIVDGAKEGNEFSIPKNMERLEYFIRDSGADVVFIDPLPSFLDAGTSYSDDSVARPIAVKLGKLARELNVCLIPVFHLTKSNSGTGINRPAGAISWIGECRTAFLLEPDKEDENKRYLIHTKANICRNQGIFEMDIEHLENDISRMVFGRKSFKSESDILDKDWKRK